jgi:hypothetical protein
MEKDKEYYRKKLEKIHADLPDAMKKFDGFTEEQQKFAQEMVILLMSCTDQIDDVLDKHIGTDPAMAVFLLPKILDYLLARIFKGLDGDPNLLAQILEQSFKVIANFRKGSADE